MVGVQMPGPVILHTSTEEACEDRLAAL